MMDVNPNRKTFPSKVSYALLGVIFLVFFGPLVPELIAGNFSGKVIGVLLFLAVLYAFIVHLFLKTNYTIDQGKLLVKCGVFSLKPIDISAIKEVSETKSIISSPAPSFDRIEIKYGKYNSIIISPSNKYGFVKDLTELNPDIKDNVTG